MAIALMLTKTDIAELLELAQWLERQPCKSAYSSEIPKHLRQWADSYMQPKRSHSKIIYYQVGYGWRLNRQWKSNLYKLTFIANKDNAIPN